MAGLKERLRWLAKNLNVMLVNIYGVSGSGKTNLALSLVEAIDSYYSSIVYMKVEDLRDVKRLDRNKQSILILDDFTYLASKHSQVVDQFLREIMLIRHKLQKTAIIIITHYLTSSLPALRSSHIKAVTSVTSRSEIKQLASYFDLDALWDFYAKYTANPLQYYALINALGKHYIYKPRISKYYSRVDQLIREGRKRFEISTAPHEPPEPGEEEVEELINFSTDPGLP